MFRVLQASVAPEGWSREEEMGWKGDRRGRGGSEGGEMGGGEGERDWHKGTDKKINQSKFFFFIDST